MGFTAFAALDASYSSLEKIQFNSVISNEGVSYDAANSQFTCPITGLYLFNVNVYTSGFERMEAVLRVVSSGQEVERVTAYSANNEPNGSSNSVVIMCEEGWIVDVICGPYRDCEYNAEEFYAANSFSGVLVTELTSAPDTTGRN